MSNSQMIQTDLDSVLTLEELAEIDHELEHIPYKSGAAIDALEIVQSSRGWVSDECLQAIAKHLEMSSEELEGVATFYNLIYRRPVGDNVVLFCDSVSCWINGCDDIKEMISQKLGVDYGDTTSDNAYTLLPVPCLGACDRAPVMMVGDDLVTHLDRETIDTIFANKESGSEI